MRKIASLLSLLVVLGGPPRPTMNDVEFYGSPWMMWHGHLIIDRGGVDCIVGPLLDDEWREAVATDRGGCVYISDSSEEELPPRADAPPLLWIRNLVWDDWGLEAVICALGATVVGLLGLLGWLVLDLVRDLARGQ